MSQKKPFAIIGVMVNGFEAAGITVDMIQTLQTEYNIHLVKLTGKNDTPKESIVGYLEVSHQGNLLTMNKETNASAEDVLAVLSR